MKHNQSGYTQTFQLLLGMMLLGSLMLSGPARAAGVTAPLDLATIPLANSPTITIQPNLLYVLDDSGSMKWNFMPDQLGYNLNDRDNFKCRRNTKTASNDDTSNTTKCSGGNYNDVGDGGDPPIYSYRINTVYYNPSIYYQPPVNPCNLSASLPSQTDWTKVRDNGLDINETCGQTSSEVNITNAYPERVYCDVSGGVVTALSKTSGSGKYACKRNGIDHIGAANTDHYDYPNNTGNWYGGTFGTYRYGRDYFSNPHYYNVIPREHCTDRSLTSCVLSTVPTATHKEPAYIRYCNTDAQASNTAAQGAVCQAAFVRTGTGSRTYARYGTFQRVDIKPAVTSYPKALGRTDCAGATCTYSEEMTNFANWYAYYRTRSQMMKSSSGLAFKDVGESFRVAFMTIVPTSSNSLKFDTFNTAHKSVWYKKLYGAGFNTKGTPLRGALSIAGRIYAGKETIPTSKGVATITDPIEYECQQNFTLLTTDGFWNSDAGFKVDKSAMTNQDDKAIRPFYEGTTASSDSLADVARYYRVTDLRNHDDWGNCINAKGQNVCQSPAPSEANKKQTMATFTLGLGVDGTLAYTSDYQTATSGDFYNIKTGNKDWPKAVTEDPTAIDDLWHAAVNGEGAYFSAKDPTEVARSLKEALSSIQVKLGAGAAAATSTLNPVSGDNSAYVASYTSGHWTGNLEKRTINTVTGAVSPTTEKGNCVEDVVVSKTCDAPSSIVADGTGGYNCVIPDVMEETSCTEGGIWNGVANTCSVPVAASCTGKLRGQVALGNRKILKSSGSGLVNFTYSNLTAEQKTTYEPDFLAANLTQWLLLTSEQRAKVTGESLVNYLRGQTALDENAADPVNRVFRKRQAVLGDVVNARPAFIGKPTFSYVDYGYDQFKSDHATRAGVVYVASNDGMLHAFDANTLEEKWAYIPSMVIPNMWKLADTAYDSKHSYYVDGDPVISDICVSGCGGAGATWKTILVGGLNAGGRGYYALDITNPAAQPTLLWEFDASDDADLGYTFGNPVVTKTPDGDWVVLVTSGYNNIPDNDAYYALGTTKFKPNNPPQFKTGDGKGYLYVLNAATGTKLKRIATGAGSTSVPSGLGKITAYAEDAEQNNTAEYVYGGDLLGNLWRFDFSDYSVKKLAQLSGADGPQPITTKPEIGLIKKKRVIFVGTGKYLEVSDLTNTEQQTLYAIRDNGTTVNTGGLVQQTMAVVDGDKRESTSNNAVNWDTGYGWYINFPSPGERQHVASSLVLGTLLVPTTVPESSACQPSGFGWLSYFDYRTGLSVQDNNLVSQMFGAPVVGFNVVYIDGKPKVNVVKADDPNPELVPGIPFTGSGSGFNRTRSIWRELITD
jgi:type IV pilus assembly protein PilY1